LSKFRTYPVLFWVKSRQLHIFTALMIFVVELGRSVVGVDQMVEEYAGHIITVN